MAISDSGGCRSESLNITKNKAAVITNGLVFEKGAHFKSTSRLTLNSSLEPVFHSQAYELSKVGHIASHQNQIIRGRHCGNVPVRIGGGEAASG